MDVTSGRAARIGVACVAAGLIGVGPGALLSPKVGAWLFGVPAEGSGADAYLLAAASRDVAIGIMLVVLLVGRVRSRIVAWAVAAVALIPALDAVDVWAHVGVRAPLSLAVHCGSAAFLAVIVGVLWRDGGDVTPRAMG